MGVCLCVLPLHSGHAFSDMTGFCRAKFLQFSAKTV
jgi:hypothetical protein